MIHEKTKLLRVFFATALIFAQTNKAIETAETLPVLSPIKIQSPLLEVIDGSIDIATIMLIAAKFYALQHGEGAERKGVIPFKNGKYTLERMAEIEQQNKTRSERMPLKIALDAAIGIAMSISKMHAQEIRSPNNKDYLAGIVDQWRKQRRKESTLLTNWAKYGDRDFAGSIKSFATLKNFMDDLQVFLKDIKYSCPLSTKVFEARLKKRQQG